ncbi:MAG TPA: DUF3300 domain-containing protein [Candidatus Udaeobacter sp.]|nr:DUF3300 domain-containing protein [Candidatus Udaeobacter sp.]
MNSFEPAGGFSRPRWGRQILLSLLPLGVLFAAWPQNLSAQQDEQDPAQAPQRQQYIEQTPEQLQQLVAPIALYPDSLVAQILAASTFPEQVVEADRWVQAHPEVKGDALGEAVDQQPWDLSVKALTTFPSVLGNMDKNLSWTSSLGDAYYNREQDVMDAVQVMRQRAQEAGNLKTTGQQTVTTQDSTIIIEPSSPEIVYVPAYDPWVVYGGPIVAWPGWYPYPGIWYGGPYLSFGVGFGIGYVGGYGWGWHHWGSDWHHRSVIHDHDRYYSRSHTFYNRNNNYRGGDARGGVNRDRGGFSGDRGADRARSNEGNKPPNANAGGRGAENRPGQAARPFEGNNQAARGYAEPRGQNGTRSGAFSGYDHGGETRSYSSRGSASFGGGGARGGGSSHH